MNLSKTYCLDSYTSDGNCPGGHGRPTVSTNQRKRKEIALVSPKPGIIITFQCPRPLENTNNAKEPQKKLSKSTLNANKSAAAHPSSSPSS